MIDLTRRAASALLLGLFGTAAAVPTAYSHKTAQDILADALVTYGSSDAGAVREQYASYKERELIYDYAVFDVCPDFSDVAFKLSQDSEFVWTRCIHRASTWALDK